MKKTILITSLLAAAIAPVQAGLFITEVHPSGSGNGTYAADWFELTNTDSTAVTITGWTMDDSSNGSVQVALRGLTTIPAGKSAVFFEGTATGSTDAAISAAFSTAWFGSATLPSGFLLGAYGGSGVGLSTAGDAVNIFDGGGARITGVAFGAATTGVTFDNAADLGSTTLPLPIISTLSSAGVNGAFLSANGGEIGSPGFAPVPEPGSALVGFSVAAFAVSMRRRAARRAQA